MYYEESIDFFYSNEDKAVIVALLESSIPININSSTQVVNLRFVCIYLDDNLKKKSIVEVFEKNPDLEKESFKVGSKMNIWGKASKGQGANVNNGFYQVNGVMSSVKGLRMFNMRIARRFNHLQDFLRVDNDAVNQNDLVSTLKNHYFFQS